MRYDVVGFVNNILESCVIPKNLNRTLISLIHKIEDPKSIKQFRPINLYNTTYKIVTKVLVQKFRTLLNDIISPNQSSFLPGGGIENNYIVASEILYYMKGRKGNKGCMAIKIDLEKAYDRLE